MSGRGVHRGGTLVLSTLMIVVGIALVVQAASATAALSSRLLLGVLFVAGGAGRMVIERRRGRRS
jgi:uncharacterized membrane protein HdeD (DUF308 family)